MTMVGKGAYLRKVTSALCNTPPVSVGTELEGTTPPSVFIGRAGYPSVRAGPLIAPIHGDCTIMDSPESWIAENRTQEEIIGYRMNLVRGVRTIGVRDHESSYARQLQEIALTRDSAESQAVFSSPPRGSTFSEDHAPFGPSAELERMTVEEGKWDPGLEKAYYDTDLIGGDAIWDLYCNDVSFSRIQKAFSTGAMGVGRRRRLVPTRWSITACDSTIGNRLLARVKTFPVLDTVRLHTFQSLNNLYAVLLFPMGWHYEWTEAFTHVLGREEIIFSDFEGLRGKKEYSPVGGCFYSCRMAVLEALAREEHQAGAIVLREARRGYVPMGVFNVRENVRQALRQPAREFEHIRGALQSLEGSFGIPISRFISEGTILGQVVRGRQATLGEFDCPS